MVTIEWLDALDHLMWLRTGSRAAEALNCNQSTISRNAKKCQETLGLSLIKCSSEWITEGETRLLRAERRVHQLYRWNQQRTLRLDGQHWLRGTYTSEPLAGWRFGNLNYLEYERPQYLLKERIIDAWLCSAPDLPSDPELTAIRLCTMPTYLVVKKGHPLLERGSDISVEAIKPYPLLPLPDNVFPIFQAQLSQFLAGGPGAPSQNRPNPSQHHAIEDLLIGLASPLTLNLYDADWVRLPLSLPISVGDTLVLHRDCAGHPRAQQLIDALVQRLEAVAQGHPDIRLLQPAGVRG